MFDGNGASVVCARTTKWLRLLGEIDEKKEKKIANHVTVERYTINVEAQVNVSAFGLPSNHPDIDHMRSSNCN